MIRVGRYDASKTPKQNKDLAPWICPHHSYDEKSFEALPSFTLYVEKE